MDATPLLLEVARDLGFVALGMLLALLAVYRTILRADPRETVPPSRVLRRASVRLYMGGESLKEAQRMLSRSRAGFDDRELTEIQGYLSSARADFQSVEELLKR